ncbi:MAG: TAXI family TRAP transporter solute-binding subunit [Pseudomonadota bacterium]
MFRLFSAAVAALFSLAIISMAPIGSAFAQAHSDRVQAANNDTVSVISGGIGGTYIRIAADLQAELDGVDDLRILPIVGKGSIKNIEDLLYLRGVDIAIVQSDVLTYLRNKQVYENIQGRVNYITKLYNEELHLVARRDITDIRQLRGKKVNFGSQGSGTYMTSETVFGALGIKVTPSSHGYEDALEKVRTGEIDAMVYVAGKPASIFTSVKRDDGLHIVPVPYTAKLQQSYLPAKLSADDYGNLVDADSPVDTIAVGAVMAVFNWKPKTGRYYRVKRFIESFFTQFDEFQKAPRHQKWGEVNLAAELPGWRRYAVAEAWLAANKAKLTAAAPTQKQRKLFEAFQAYLASQGRTVALSQSDQKILFNKFIQWNEAVSKPN